MRDKHKAGDMAEIRFSQLNNKSVCFSFVDTTKNYIHRLINKRRSEYIKQKRPDYFLFNENFELISFKEYWTLVKHTFCFIN